MSPGEDSLMTACMKAVTAYPEPVPPPLPRDLREVHAVDVRDLLPPGDGGAGHHVVHLPHVHPDCVRAARVVEEASNHGEHPTAF